MNKKLISIAVLTAGLVLTGSAFAGCGSCGAGEKEEGSHKHEGSHKKGAEAVIATPSANIGAAVEAYIAANGKADITIPILIRNITEVTNGVQVHLALSTGTHSPNLVTVIGNVQQHTRLRIFVVRPLAVVLAHDRVHVLEPIRAT